LPVLEYNHNTNYCKVLQTVYVQKHLAKCCIIHIHSTIITVVKKVLTKARITGGTAGQCNVTSISVNHCSQLPQSRCCQYWFFCCVKHRNVDSQWFLMGRAAPKTHKSAPSGRGSRPHLTHGSLSPPKSALQTASRSVQSYVFAGLTNVTNRQTYRLTTLCATAVSHWTRSRGSWRLYSGNHTQTLFLVASPQ